MIFILTLIDLILVAVGYMAIRSKKMWGYLLSLVALLPGVILFVQALDDVISQQKTNILFSVLILFPIGLLILGISFVYKITIENRMNSNIEKLLRIGKTVFYIGISSIILGFFVAIFLGESPLFSLLFVGPFFVLISGGTSLLLVILNRSKEFFRLFFYNLIVSLIIVLSWIYFIVLLSDFTSHLMMG